MSSNFSGVNPLSYVGVTPATPPPVTFQDRAPTSDDIQNFSLSTIWLDKEGEKAYMLVSKDVGVAIWLPLGGTLNGVQTLTTPDTNVVSPVNGNINFLNGSGMAITGSGDDVTFSTIAPPFMIQWNVITTPTATLVINEGFISNAGGGVTFSLPVTCAVGDVFFVNNVNAGGWTIAQNAGQSIRMGNMTTTVGVGGSLASTDIGDSIAFVCWDANTSFTCTSSMGNITVT